MSTATAAWPICEDCHIPALTSVRMSAGPLVLVCPSCAHGRMIRFAPDLAAEALGELAAAAQQLMPGLMVEVRGDLLLRGELRGPLGPIVQWVTVLPASGEEIGPWSFWWRYESEFTDGIVLTEAIPVRAVADMAAWLRRKLTGRSAS